MVFAESTADVVDIVKVCAAHGVPVIPFGVGSSLEGHINAPGGGISIDLLRMNRVLAVHPEDLDCVVEPGVTRQMLNEHLRDTGLFFPIDPGAEASLGGMAATRASGTNAVRYGTMRDNVLNLTAVMPDGSVVKTGHRAKKSSAGYDLTRLLIGSEGTLGVITELTLKLYGIPEAIAGGVCPFPSVEAACNAVILTIQSGIPVARIELLDALQVKACNAYSKLSLPETPTLFLEFHGTHASVEEQSEQFGAIAAEFGAGEFLWETTPEERNKLWKARHDVYWACMGLRPGAKVVATDVCVPISRLAECVTETAADIERERLVGADRRPCRRRQFPRHHAGRPRGRRRGSPRRGLRRPAQPPRHRHGRHLHRRARRRPGQDEVPRRRAREGARRDAVDQARDRSRQHHEPGQDRRRHLNRGRQRGVGPLNRLYLIIGGLVVIALFAALIAPWFINWDDYKANFEAEADQDPRPAGARQRHGRREHPALALADLHRCRGRRDRGPADDVGQALLGDHRADAAGPGRDPRHLDEARGAGGAGRGRRCRQGRLDDPRRGLARPRSRQGRPRAASRSRTARSIYDDARSGSSVTISDIAATVEARSLAGPWRVEGSYTTDGAPAQFQISTGRRLEDGSLRVKADVTPGQWPIAIGADGVVTQGEGGPSYTGTYNLTQVLPAATEDEEGRGDVTGWRSEGSFKLTREQLVVDKAVLSEGPPDRPSSLAGSMTLTLGPASRFFATVQARQLDLDRSLGEGPKKPIEMATAADEFVKWLRGIPVPGIAGTVRFNVPGDRRRRRGDPGRELRREPRRQRLVHRGAPRQAAGRRDLRRRRQSPDRRAGRASAATSSSRSTSRPPSPRGGAARARPAPGASSRPSN